MNYRELKQALWTLADRDNCRGIGAVLAGLADDLGQRELTPTELAEDMRRAASA